MYLLLRCCLSQRKVGHSTTLLCMAPDYPNGAQVLIKKVDEKAFIEWGRVYVLDTCNGSVIKEVRKGDDDDSVQCYSLNPDPKYQPFAVRFADIYGMYRVLMCMSLK